MNPVLTIFVPAFNEGDSLEHCVEVMLEKMALLETAAEVLVVDDGSQDGTGELADRLAVRYENVRALHHPTNLGIGGAFRTAVEHAQGEWMILIPADLALDSAELGRYLQAAPKADIVVGLRSDRSDYTMLRRLVSWSNIFLIRLLFNMHLRQYQYISMYRMSVLRGIQIEYWRSAFFLAEVLIKARDQGYRLVEVEIRYAPRLAGHPTGARLKLVILTLRDIVHFWPGWLMSQFVQRRS